MRTGGVDQARMSRNRKKTPKSKPKKAKHPTSLQTPNNSTAPMPSVAEPTSQVDGEAQNGATVEMKQGGVGDLTEEVDKIPDSVDKVRHR